MLGMLIVKILLLVVSMQVSQSLLVQYANVPQLLVQSASDSRTRLCYRC